MDLDREIDPKGPTELAGNDVGETFDAHMRAVKISIAFSIAGAISAGIYTWVNAPVIGGDAWTYVHVAVTFLGAICGSALLGMVGYAITFAHGMLTNPGQ